MRKQIAVLGSTGWVGRTTLQVIRHLSQEFEVAVLAAKSNIDLLFSQALEFSPKCIAVFDPISAQELERKLPKTCILAGMEGLQAAACYEGVDFVMLAMTGGIGLLPAVSAISAGKRVGLANKEALVSGGEWLCGLAKHKGVEIIPVDSELCALHQCLRSGQKKEVRRFILTASGGIFRNKTQEELREVKVADALRHPNWSMGAKSMVDCATLMNKGLEMIGARYLFDVEPDQIEAVIHPQSRVQSCVEFVDGSLLAQIGEPDMALPIQYALTYPDRSLGIGAPYNFFKNETLTFFPPDDKKFPCLRLAMEAMRGGKSYPCFLNGANEILVERFLQGAIPFSSIGEKLEKLIASHRPENMLTLDAILSVDQNARELAKNA